MNTNVLLAVFKRNFVSYFASPLGYLFICVFNTLSTVAAFFPHEFFNNNLANLDQLNQYFPWIMLVFIPAITMSVWADERRQGTDELLLTIPAGDFDIVLGKYLATVGIYTVSLLYSLLCTYLVLRTLGNPDLGLFVATYFGYWMVGLAMLAIGMVASFLTGNLTVSYMLGALFNVPLVFLAYADSIPYLERLAIFREAAQGIKQWSFAEQFSDFGRGVVTFSSLAYFLMLVAAMLYLSMIFIGRRHWVRGRGWVIMAAHYSTRVLALIAIVVGANVIFSRFDVRADVTAERLSSLTPQTVELLGNLKLERPVQIEAFISQKVPESYVQTQHNLLNMLRELKARGGDKVVVRINDKMDRYTEDAARAEKRFGITARRVATINRGAMSEDHLFMGVAFTSGLQKVILPFIDRGIPVEYELVRSILSVTDQKRKKIGVLTTDAQLFGQFNMQAMSSSSNWPIIDELQKSYEVVQVDPSQPITEEYDAILAVQPSSLSQEQMTNFIAAIRSGRPVAIFEDPLPAFAGNVPGTVAPKRPPAGNPMMMQNPAMMQKGNIKELWTLLGIDFSGARETGGASPMGMGPPSGDCDIVYQDYNPYPKLSHLPGEFVFVDKGCGAKEPFSAEDVATAGLQHALFPFPGYISALNASTLEFTPLVRTGERTGVVQYSNIFEMGIFGQPGGLNPGRRRRPQDKSFVLAARIKGKIPPARPMADEGKDDEHAGHDHVATEATKAETSAKPEAGEVNVVLVSDIDFLHNEFFRLREQGDIPDAGIHFDFDNVTFVLNVLDELAGETRFFEIRSRRPAHRTLTAVDRATEQYRKDSAKEIDELTKEFEKVREEEEKNLNAKIDELRKQFQKEQMGSLEIAQRLDIVLKEGNQRIEQKVEQLKQESERKKNRIETERVVRTNRVLDWYKSWAAVSPQILPLVVAIVFFFVRRSKEREGVSRSRLRS